MENDPASGSLRERVADLRGALAAGMVQIEAVHEELRQTRRELSEKIESADDKIVAHDRDEKPRIERIERLVLIALGGLTVIAALVPLGIEIIQRSVGLK